MLLYLDYLGVFVFALSGALMAIRKDMDLFGVLVLALMPAVGGGTLRDLTLGIPVFWVQENIYLYLATAAAITAKTAQITAHAGPTAPGRPMTTRARPRELR